MVRLVNRSLTSTTKFVKYTLRVASYGLLNCRTEDYGSGDMEHSAWRIGHGAWSMAHGVKGRGQSAWRRELKEAD